MKHTIKFISAILSLIFCLTAFAGCKAGKKDENPKETTFNYEVKRITDEPHSIDELNDAVTVAITQALTETTPEYESFYYCESHRIVASINAADADSFDVLAHRGSTYYFDPDTGNYVDYRDLGMYCLMSLTKAENGFETVSYEEFSTIDAALTAADGVFGDADAVKENYTDVESTPYRYTKDGKIYLLDYERYITYCDNLIAKILNASKVTDSYKPIITNNKKNYEKLLDSYFVTDYVIGQFLEGKADSPKAYVLYRALEDILERKIESIDYKPEDEKNAQVYFEKLLEHARDMRAEEGTVSTSYTLPTWCRLIHLYDQSLTDEEALAEKYIYANPDKMIVHSNNGTKEFVKGDDGYADILRENQRWYIDKQYAFICKSNVKSEVAIREYCKNESPDGCNYYIEYVYEDGKTPNYIFSCNASLMLVPVAGGLYDAYTTGSVSSNLSDILDGLCE